MIRPKIAWRTTAVLGAACLALAACANEGGETPGTGTSQAPAAVPADGVLKIGTLLPQTGSLAFLGPPEFAGVNLAVKEINDAGGVLGKPVTASHTDSGDTSTDIATQSVNKLLTEKVDVIIGAASSSVSLSVIDKITGAGVVQISPANTSDTFTTYNDKGLYFRTAPPDVLQGRVLGDLVVQDGNATVGMLVLQDAYGTGLAKNARAAIESGGGQVVAEEVYDPKAADYSAEVGNIKAKNPQAIILIGFDETAKIIPKLVEAGLTAKAKKWYFVDGNLSNSYKFPNGTLQGAKGTLPGAKAATDFQAKLKEIDPKLEDYSYAPESYDAAILSALAAEAAKSDSPTEIAKQLAPVSKGGTKCKTFKECKDLLTAGTTDIDYDGVSGPVEWNDAGDPAEATIGIYQYGADNKYTNVTYLSGKIAG